MVGWCMDIADATVGKLVLVTTASIFAVLVFWIDTYPFIDEELGIYSYIPDPQWFLLFCALWGLLFGGGLMTFTLYHLLPFL